MNSVHSVHSCQFLSQKLLFSLLPHSVAYPETRPAIHHLGLRRNAHKSHHINPHLSATGQQYLYPPFSAHSPCLSQYCSQEPSCALALGLFKGSRLQATSSLWSTRLFASPSCHLGTSYRMMERSSGVHSSLEAQLKKTT